MNWKCFLVLYSTGLGLVAGVSDWKTPKRVNRDQYSLKLHQTLEVKTTSNLQNSRIILEFKDGANEFYLKFKCADVSSSTWIYVLQGCMKHRNNWRSALTMTGVPHDEIKIWKITRTTTHLRVVCNGVTVVNFNFATDYRDRYRSCSETWGQSTEAKIYFPRLGLYRDEIFMRILSTEFSLVDQNGNEVLVEDRVEGLLLSNGGTVCGNGFSDNSAEAICREMGFFGGRSWRNSNQWSAYQDSLDITLNGVECGSKDWSSCTYNFGNNCTHREDVFLECEGIRFRLVNRLGNDIGARIEGLLLSNGGTVCDDSFSDNSADAICREMGFTGSRSWRRGYIWKSYQATLEITLDDVECASGDWSSCTYNFRDNCGHHEDVFLECDGPEVARSEDDPQGLLYAREAQFTLVNSDGEAAGAGELGLLLYNHGTVCDDSFNYNAAEAICAELGFLGATRWTSRHRFSIQYNYEITLDDVRCSDESWENCTFSESHNCDQSEVVFLACTNQTEGEAQFSLLNSDGEAAGAGELGLLLYNHGTVCDDSFNYNAAEAICVELGFLGATRWTSHQTFSIQYNYEITLDDVRCSDNSWENCTFSESHNCQHSEDVFLACRNVEGETEFTLVDSAGEEAGAGELGLLLYNGGTVCDDDFDNNAAAAICVELGFSGATRWTSRHVFSIQRNYEITLDDVRCDGESWTTCSFSTDHNCGHPEDIFLQCF